MDPAVAVKERAKEVLTGSGILQNPYLDSLARGSLPLEALRRTQEQDDLFEAAGRCSGRDGRLVLAIEGLELGAYAFDRLYRDLHHMAGSPKSNC